ncbi:ROK family protein [Tardiphaga sp.]|jgi:polyphosphate glucokinase|uniref:ROK family protein n=1 Tax=Tardiphaga sp. TaxID=1926292 RepID=UPI0037D9C26C
MNKRRKQIVLAIDVGGTHVKVMTTAHRTKREFESGAHLTAKTMVKKVKQLTSDWTYDRVSIGYPGPVIGNRAIREPHNLGRGWKGFDFEAAFDRPARVVNDALMQALGSYDDGRMLFLGLGTGLGSAMIIDGILEPMELGHLPYRKKTFEDYIGAAGLERLGRKKWRRRVAEVINDLREALEPDYIVLGGGNVAHIDELPPKTRRGDNENAFLGGFRLWEPTTPSAKSRKKLRNK